MERPISLRLGELLQLENGTFITAINKTRRYAKPNSVALHEAAHAQVAGIIQWATIIPTSFYLGATMPLILTAASAMAAKALGYDGTGHDEHITKYVLGVDPHSAESSALSALSGKMDYVYAIAEELQEEKIIGQSNIEKAHQRVDRQRRGIWDVEVRIVEADGSIQTHRTESEENTVLIPNEWVTPVMKRKENS